MSDYDKECGTQMAMKVLKVIGMIILGVGAAFLFGLVTMLLWNWLMPEIFNLPQITYWQSVGLMILSCILLGRIGGGSSDEKKKGKGKNPIRDEIRKEIEKEIEKEYAKKQGSEENTAYERMYEKWWDSQGKQSFEEFAKQTQDKE